MNPLGKCVGSGHPGGRVPNVECRPRKPWPGGPQVSSSQVGEEGVSLPDVGESLAGPAHSREFRLQECTQTWGPLISSPPSPFSGSPGFQEEHLLRAVPLLTLAGPQPPCCGRAAHRFIEAQSCVPGDLPPRLPEAGTGGSAPKPVLPDKRHLQHRMSNFSSTLWPFQFDFSHPIVESITQTKFHV